jgi:transcriptional regulator with XRE-family HTH domain
METTIACQTSQTWNIPEPNPKNGLDIGLAKSRFNLPTKKAVKTYAGFADRLQQACDEAGYPAGRNRVSTVAARFGVSSESARQWLNGQSMPEMTRLAEMADELECSLDWLVLGRLPSSGQVREPGAAYKALTTEERAVIASMRRLNARRRAALVQLLTEN